MTLNVSGGNANLLLGQILTVLYTALAKLDFFTFDSVRKYALIVMDEAHSFIHEDTMGAYFECCSPINTSTTTTVPFLWVINNSDESVQIHLTAFPKLSGGGGCIFRIYEGGTPNSPRSIANFDRNRVRSDASTLSTCQDVVFASGTLIYEELYIGEANTEHAHDKMEFVLKFNTWYLFEITQLAQDSISRAVVLNWYEHR
jgi:hypothetical protein